MQSSEALVAIIRVAIAFWVGVMVARMRPQSILRGWRISRLAQREAIERVYRHPSRDRVVSRDCIRKSRIWMEFYMNQEHHHHDRPPPRRKQSFLGKHNRLISLCGTIVVFVTFVAKEGFAEHWKDEAHDIDLAVYVFTMRIQSIHIQDRLIGVSNGLTEFRMAWEKKANGALSLADEFSSDDEHVEDMKSELQNIVDTHLVQVLDLFSRLPEQQANVKSANEIVIQKYQLWNFLRDQQTIIEAAPRGGDLVPSGKDAQEVTEMNRENESKRVSARKAYETARQKSDEVNAIRQRADQLVHKAFADANALRLKIEAQSERAWWIAAFLYTIGLSLTVIGRVNESPSGAEG